MCWGAGGGVGSNGRLAVEASHGLAAFGRSYAALYWALAGAWADGGEAAGREPEGGYAAGPGDGGVCDGEDGDEGACAGGGEWVEEEADEDARWGADSDEGWEGEGDADSDSVSE